MKLARYTLPAMLLLAGALHAQAASQALFAKTHNGEKEAVVADKWYKDKLRNWVMGLTARNQFIQTWLPLDSNFSKSAYPCKFEIRDADIQTFNAFPMIRDGMDGEGRPTYKAGKTSKRLPWGMWPARFIVSSYPVETNADVNDMVAFSAWLVVEKENDLANRVLTLAHHRNKELAPLIEAFLAEKYGWKDPGALVEWNMWDSEFQVERIILATAAEKTARTAAREKAAQKAFSDLLSMRGDYKGKPDQRRKPPTKVLVFVEWEIKEFKKTYASSDFIKDAKNADVLEDLLKSIKDDQDAIRDNWANAEKTPKDPTKDIKGITDECLLKEKILKLDPENVNLRSQLGDKWYALGATDEYGNDCLRPEAVKKAIVHFEILLKTYPENLSFLLATGKCHQSLQDSKHALPYYNKVIQLDGSTGTFGKAAEQLKYNMEKKDEMREKKAKQDKIGEH